DRVSFRDETHGDQPRCTDAKSRLLWPRATGAASRNSVDVTRTGAAPDRPSRGRPLGAGMRPRQPTMLGSLDRHKARLTRTIPWRRISVVVRPRRRLPHCANGRGSGRRGKVEWGRKPMAIDDVRDVHPAPSPDRSPAKRAGDRTAADPLRHAAMSLVDRRGLLKAGGLTA